MTSTYDVLSTIASTSAATAVSSSSALPYAHAAFQVVGKHGLQMMAVSGAASLVVPPIITTIRGGGGGGGSSVGATSTIQVKKQQPNNKKLLPFRKRNPSN